jgi:hypothetical protein
MVLAFKTDCAPVEAPASTMAIVPDDVATQKPPINSPPENPEQGIFILLGGYVAGDGAVHREVELAPLTGNEEAFLASVPTSACAASVVTGLLSRCVKRMGSLERINPSLIRDLLVGDRDYLILRLREMTFGSKVGAILHCPDSRCGKPTDIAFSLDDLHFDPKPVSSRFFTLPLSSDATHQEGEPRDDYQVEFRLPIGADQEAVAPIVGVSETQAINQLLARCVARIGEFTEVDEPLIASLSIATRRRVEAEMERRAPHVAIELELTCPECQLAYMAPFDFTAFFLAEMRANLRRLEREVHFLAWHYHWSERDILSMTRKKRRRYVELLQEEIERFY